MLDKTSIDSRLIQLASPLAPRLTATAGDPATADLREAGLTSVGAVRLMLEIEAAFSLAIPDADLTPENFATVRDIALLIERLQAQG